MVQKKVMISIDEEIHEAYKEKCKIEGTIMSKQIELFMMDVLEWNKKKLKHSKKY